MTTSRRFLTRGGTAPARALLCGLVVATACEDESFREVRSRIALCADPAGTTCNRALDLGERPMQVPFAFPLYLFNRGDAALNVSRIAVDHDALGVEPASAVVEPAQRSVVTLTLTPTALGPAAAALRLDSDDAERSPLELPVGWSGLPVPRPAIELCLDADLQDCGSDVVVDFGSVRRSQTESRTLVVHNAGTARLEIQQVQVMGAASLEGELVVSSSTRPGHLEPGDRADVVLVYRPQDGVDDAIVLEISNDDPDTPLATARVTGSSVANLPPLADATQAGSGSTSVIAAVGEVVSLDGSDSFDPEGDPLRYQWSLFVPAQSTAELDDPAAGRVSFVPDRAGSYRVELVVYDSLEQRSELAAVVLVTARPRNALRATATWQSGGDVDLHLLRVPDLLFSTGDCYFGNPAPDLGVPGEDDDDPQLIADAEQAPGHEQIVLVAPAPGSYRLYAHYYDEAAQGAAVLTVQVVINDASTPAHLETRLLPAACTLWYVGEFNASTLAFVPVSGSLEQLCRGP